MERPLLMCPRPSSLELLVNPYPEAPGDLRTECTQVLSEKTYWPRKVVLPLSRPTQTAKADSHTFIYPFS